MKYFSVTSPLALLAALCGPPALAAPFCVQSQLLAPQCIYYDARQCDLAAQRQGAVCATNPSEVKLSPGNGRYCVVTSGQVSVCAYADRLTCSKDAALQQGTCTDAPARAGGVGAPDPYSRTDGN